MSKARVAAAALVMSAAGMSAWVASEGYTSTAVIPTKGDVPTIGHGSTRYEDGTRVKMGDTITRQRAAVLARNLAQQDCAKMAATIPSVELTQAEYDLYCDFTGQYGIGNWTNSSMRANLLRGEYVAACRSLLRYKYAAGYDCSIPGNQRCYGVWTRQVERFDKCMGAQ